MPHYTVAEFHGAVTHFPVAMIIAAMLFDIGAVLFKKAEWRIVSFWCLVTAVVGAVPSLASGWITGTGMYGKAPVLPDIFVRHRLFAFITAGITIILLAWRSIAKDKLAGAALYLSLLLVVIDGACVSYTGYLGGLMAIGSADTELGSSAPPPATPPTTGGKQQQTPPGIDPQLIAKGKDVYSKNGCANCHRLGNTGGHGGPNLTHEGTKNADVQWQIAHLKNPSKMSPGSAMPPYDSLSQADLNALAHYLVSLK